MTQNNSIGQNHILAEVSTLVFVSFLIENEAIPTIFDRQYNFLNSFANSERLFTKPGMMFLTQYDTVIFPIALSFALIT